MFFQIVPALNSGTAAAQGEVVRRRWVLRKGSEKNPGEAICQSYGSFSDDAAARSDIATSKKSFAGTKFAKVVSEDV